MSSQTCQWFPGPAQLAQHAAQVQPATQLSQTFVQQRFPPRAVALPKLQQTLRAPGVTPQRDSEGKGLREGSNQKETPKVQPTRLHPQGHYASNAHYKEAGPFAIRWLEALPSPSPKLPRAEGDKRGTTRERGRE